MLFKEKWISLLFQIQKKHYWTGHDLYHQCCHANLSTEGERSKAQLPPESESCLAFQTIVLDKIILKDIVQLTRLSHTMILEVYHSVLNKWAPKSLISPIQVWSHGVNQQQSISTKRKLWSKQKRKVQMIVIGLFFKDYENLVC